MAMMLWRIEHNAYVRTPKIEDVLGAARRRADVNKTGKWEERTYISK